MAQTGDDRKYPMPRTKLSGNPLDMSFSGLKTAAINLIHNAVKFSEEGGLLEISVRKTDMAEFEVTDHGIGMDEETMHRIFDRFYQGDTSRSHEGVGLGLSLVQRILVILGGEIKVRSRLHEGTTIRVRIPFHPPKNQHKEEPHVDQS